MSDTKNLIIYLFTLCISIELYLYFTIDNIDIYNKSALLLHFIAKIGLIYSIYYDNKKIVKYFHILFGINIILISLLADNSNILLYHTMVLFVILFLRRKYDHCIIRDFEKKKKKRKPSFKWDYINLFMGLFSIIRVIYNINKKK